MNYKSEVFTILNHYAQLNHIPLKQFWTSPRLCLTLQQFNKLLIQVPLQLDPSLRNEFITVEQLIQNVPYWRQSQQSVTKYLLSSPEPQKKQPTARRQKQHLRKHLQTQMQKECELNQTLLKSAQESEYELTLKIGQANDFARLMKNPIQFICIKEQSGRGLKIYLKENERQEIITEKQFAKKYEELRYEGSKRGNLPQANIEQDLKKTMLEVMCLSTQLQEQIKLLQRKGVQH